MARYSKLKKAYMEQFPICEICKERQAVDIHHRLGRTGERLNQTSWWMALCRQDHDKVHREPIWATKMGYTLSRLSNETH